MPGDLQPKYAAEVALTFTSINSLAGSSTFLGGAVSLVTASNATTLALDYLVSAKVTWTATVPAAGTYRLDTHVYSELNDALDYPLDGSANALGTDTTRSFATAGDKFNSTIFLKSLELAATASKVYTFPRVGIANLFAGTMPLRWGLFCTHAVTTANSTPAAAGNTFWSKPVFQQYT